jgi:hypothetical protein
MVLHRKTCGYRENSSVLSSILSKYSWKLFASQAVFSEGYQDSTYIVLDVLEAEGHSYSHCK